MRTSFEEWWVSHADPGGQPKRKPLIKRLQKAEHTIEELNKRIDGLTATARQRDARHEAELFEMLERLTDPRQQVIQRAKNDHPHVDVERIDITTYGDPTPRYLPGLSSACIRLYLDPTDDLSAIIGKTVGVNVPGLQMTRGFVNESSDAGWVGVVSDGPFRVTPMSQSVADG